MAAKYSYDEFGQTTVDGDYTFSNEICYTGSIYDWASGQCYLNARYYDPETGRFLSEDTYRGDANEPNTLHLYAYCAHNPINYVDPSGHAIAFANLYNTLTNSQKGKLTQKERKLLKLVPSVYCHFHRNENNTKVPNTLAKAKALGWTRNYGDWAHQFNQKMKRVRNQRGIYYIAQRNLKYKKGNKEVVYYYDGTLDDTPEDRGSYNFDTGTEHSLKDVVPWVAWGNSCRKYNKTQDSTSTGRRFSCVPQTWFGWTDASKAFTALQKINKYGTIR